MRKLSVLLGWILVGLVLAPALPAHRMEKDGQLYPYPIAGKIDLGLLLAPAPAVDSEQTKMEIDELLKIQDGRTEAMAAAAISDHAYDVFRFADVLGPKFNAQNLPLTADFFARVIDSGKSVVEPAKNIWGRLRPAYVDSRIVPVIKEPKSGSYPSGHATAGTVMAIVLAAMVPEKSAELHARGWSFARNRLISGAHFPSDIQAGRIAGTLIASYLFQDPEFKKDFLESKAELRKSLGYQ